MEEDDELKIHLSWCSTWKKIFSIMPYFCLFQVNKNMESYLFKRKRKNLEKVKAKEYTFICPLTIDTSTLYVRENSMA